MKMKKIKYIGLFTILATFSLGSCNDDFLEEKKDYNGVNEEVFQEPLLAQAYVDYVYNQFLPGDNAVTSTWDLAAGTNLSDFAKTTEELAGETNLNKTWASISPNGANCLPYIGARMGSGVSNNTWTRLKQINLFLDNVDKYGMDKATKDKLKGQLYFWRAWQYFDMVRLYGGVPLVLTSQNPILADASVNQIPRSSTSACIEQIVADLDMAKSLLPGKWIGADYGRITSGACAAMKGRVLLTWASPLFNPTDDTQRWQRAYDANLEAKTLLEANGFGLATDWGAMWTKEGNTANPEAVLVYAFNTVITQNIERNNGSERACRSKEAFGAGSISPTKQMVDAFPMADGKDITSSSATLPYNPVRFYKNRDPRFYKTFAYNGAKWPYAENVNFKQWTYSWFKTSPTTDLTKASTTELLGANSTGIYLNKATSATASNNTNFAYSGTDYMEMRFAEVVLNLAESAIGINKLAEGKTLIESIRKRAGVLIGDGNYGLASATSRDQLFGAALKERKVEFAYENKRFYDLRRWLLFDNTAGTTTRLGIAPLNGTRRTGYYIIAKNTAGARYVGTADPFLPNALGVAAIVSRDPAAFPYIIPATGKNPGTSIANYDAYVDYLYDNYFEIVERDNLENSAVAGWKFTWYKEYNYFGIYQTLLDTAPYLEQTKGWGGTFDPLK
jgi:hypothetical protein